MNEILSDIIRRRKQVESQIRKEEQACGRVANSCALIAVSKRQTNEKIEALWQTGHRRFGENTVEEAERHWLSKRQQGNKFHLHLIGHLQSNKAARAVALFDVIETLDSMKLAKKIEAAMEKTRRTPQLLIQVNTGEEEQKYGIPPNHLAEFLNSIKAETRLNISGLMCLPPKQDEPGLHFALLAKLAAQHNLPQLSMGMSNDFETAIRFGATSVRVGSALFGCREY